MRAGGEPCGEIFARAWGQRRPCDAAGVEAEFARLGAQVDQKSRSA
jgi:hypothetical protein